MEFLRIFGSLVLVFGLLGGVLWGLKRMQSRLQVTQGSRRLQVIDSLSLGARQKLVLVRADGHQVLVGVSPGQMTALGQWTGDDAEARTGFAQALQAQAQAQAQP